VSAAQRERETASVQLRRRPKLKRRKPRRDCPSLPPGCGNADAATCNSQPLETSRRPWIREAGLLFWARASQQRAVGLRRPRTKDCDELGLLRTNTAIDQPHKYVLPQEEEWREKHASPRVVQRLNLEARAWEPRAGPVSGNALEGLADLNQASPISGTEPPGTNRRVIESKWDSQP